LNLLPEDVAQTVILVGDPQRVPLVSQYFDQIDVKKEKREFFIQTGWIGEKRMTVLSTGIGTDNIDIVLNELDALFNIDLESRQLKEQFTSLNLIRIGTSGSIHPNVHVGDIVISGLAVGTDSLGCYYSQETFQHNQLPSWSYLTRRHNFNLSEFSLDYQEGITLTCPGFYGPQGRTLRIPAAYEIPIDSLHQYEIEGLHFTNLEMETSGIYLLARLLNHKAISFNAILAERLHGKFSSKSIEPLIEATLNWATRID
jgi:uridine phosphorylase